MEASKTTVTGLCYPRVPRHLLTSTGLTRDDVRGGQALCGLPVYCEHNENLPPCGRVVDGYLDPGSGDLWVLVELADSPAGQLMGIQVARGLWPEFSVGHEVRNGTRTVREISFVRKGAREGCHVYLAGAGGAMSPVATSGAATLSRAKYKAVNRRLVQCSRRRPGTQFVYASHASMAAPVAEGGADAEVAAPMEVDAAAAAAPAEAAAPVEEVAPVDAAAAAPAPAVAEPPAAPPAAPDADGNRDSDVDMSTALKAATTETQSVLADMKMMGERMKALESANKGLVASQAAAQKELLEVVTAQMKAFGTPVSVQDRINMQSATPAMLGTMVRASLHHFDAPRAVEGRAAKRARTEGGHDSAAVLSGALASMEQFSAEHAAMRERFLGGPVPPHLVRASAAPAAAAGAPPARPPAALRVSDIASRSDEAAVAATIRGMLGLA